MHKINVNLNILYVHIYMIILFQWKVCKQVTFLNVSGFFSQFIMILRYILVIYVWLKHIFQIFLTWRHQRFMNPMLSLVFFSITILSLLSIKPMLYSHLNLLVSTSIHFFLPTVVLYLLLDHWWKSQYEWP